MGLTRNYEDIRTLFKRLSEPLLDRQTDTGWPVRKLALHMAQAPVRDASIAGRLAAGKHAPLTARLPWAAAIATWLRLRSWRRATKQDLLLAWEQAFNEVFACVNGLTDDELRRSGWVISGRRMTAGEYLQRSPDHVREHARSIRRTIGDPPRE